MKLIEPSAELWEQGHTIDDIWNHIARCTRVCYQSTPKDENESGYDFCKRTILKNGHTAMLEHGTVYLKIHNPGITKWFIRNPYSYVCYSFDADYITTNMRVLDENDKLDYLNYLCEPTIYHIKRYTISFITSIGITREFNRHRVNSIAEQSTRFCNYSKDKFGGEITFVKPAWYDNVEPRVQEYFRLALENAELEYMRLTQYGCSAQEAREVLPLATKSQLVHTASVLDWIHFFNLRLYGTHGTPHPNAKEVARLAYTEFINKGIEI